MAGLICDVCKLPLVPFGGESICDCQRTDSDDDDPFGEDCDPYPEHICACRCGCVVAVSHDGDRCGMCREACQP